MSDVPDLDLPYGEDDVFVVMERGENESYKCWGPFLDIHEAQSFAQTKESGAYLVVCHKPPEEGG